MLSVISRGDAAVPVTRRTRLTRGTGGDGWLDRRCPLGVRRFSSAFPAMLRLLEQGQSSDKFDVARKSCSATTSLDHKCVGRREQPCLWGGQPPHLSFAKYITSPGVLRMSLSLYPFSPSVPPRVNRLSPIATPLDVFSYKYAALARRHAAHATHPETSQKATNPVSPQSAEDARVKGDVNAAHARAREIFERAVSAAPFCLDLWEAFLADVMRGTGRKEAGDEGRVEGARRYDRLSGIELVTVALFVFSLLASRDNG